MTTSRKALRLKTHDYSASGMYFVTICTNYRKCLFGEVVNGQMQLNKFGQMVQIVWDGVDERFKNVATDQFVIMPNHIHGIITINFASVGAASVGAIHELPLRSERTRRRNMAIPKIVGYVKMNAAKRINDFRNMRSVPVWQRGYYDRIIRNEQELFETRKYILENPLKWQEDPENIDMQALEQFM